MTPFAALQACAVFASAAAAVMMLAVAPGEPASQDTEQVRLRSHFDSVLVELSTAPTTALSDQQRQRRLQLIQRLAAYRDSGWFPHNTTHPQVQLPVFRDTQGALCAMGDLMTFSGRTDLVDAVVSLDNNAYVRDLTRLDGLQSWLDSVGLSVAEAGRVQPSYGSPLFNEGQPDRGLSTQERVQLSAIVAAAAASTFAAVHPERGVANATVGVGAVVTAIGTGVFMTETSWLSLGTMVTGLTAMVIGVTARERAARAHAPPPAEARFTVTPTMMSRHNRWEPGITARLRF